MPPSSSSAAWENTSSCVSSHAWQPVSTSNTHEAARRSAGIQLPRILAPQLHKSACARSDAGGKTRGWPPALPDEAQGWLSHVQKQTPPTNGPSERQGRHHRDCACELSTAYLLRGT